MTQRGIIGNAFHTVFGPRVGDFCAGALLAFGIGLAFLVSIAVMPELSWRNLAESSATHKEMAIALRQRDEIADRLDGYRIRYFKLLTDDNPNTNLLVSRDGLFKLIALEQTRLGEAEAQLKTLRDMPARAAAADDLQMARHSRIWGWFAWATPGQLVLILTLLMGALGGIIAVARAFVQPDAGGPPTAGDYIIRPLLGAVIAFVVYMLVQVTQAMIATGAEADQLNAYPVVLIAVVAGFLATDAIGAIERWGKALFSRISAVPFGNTTAELNAKLTAERNRLAGATKKFNGMAAPQPADPKSPTKPETDAKAAYDNAKTAIGSATAALTAAETAIERHSTNATAAAAVAANNALTDLAAKVTQAVNLIDAIT